VPLFWLNYRHSKGRFAGAAVIEASTLISARMAAAVYGLNDGLALVSGHELDAETARQVPKGMIGRLLDDRDLRRLQHVLMPKKPHAVVLVEDPDATVKRRWQKRRSSGAKTWPMSVKRARPIVLANAARKAVRARWARLTPEQRQAVVAALNAARAAKRNRTRTKEAASQKGRR
jgi:hypothetical protein